MANTIQLAVGDGNFRLHVPGMKSIDNLVSVEANLDNEGEINLIDRPVISIRPVSYENENLTCEYHIHYQQNNNQSQSVNLRLSVMYRDMVIDSGQDLEAVRTKLDMLGEQVSTIQSNYLDTTKETNQNINGPIDFKVSPTINGSPIGVETGDFIKKNEVLETLCGECGWVNDLQQQITLIGQDIDKIQATQSNTYITTREITIDKAKIQQTLMGSFYIYNIDYDISQWDNNEWDLEAVTLKNIHIDDINGRSGEVHDVVKKAITSIVFDENMLYINMLTPTLFNYTTGNVKVELSCSYSRVLTKEKEGE